MLDKPHRLKHVKLLQVSNHYLLHNFGLHAVERSLSFRWPPSNSLATYVDLALLCMIEVNIPSRFDWSIRAEVLPINLANVIVTQTPRTMMIAMTLLWMNDLLQD